MKGISPTLLRGKVARRIAIEKLQMTRLLESLAQTSILQYPVHVQHTTDLVPDFQLASDNRRIAVEVTRIKFQDVEHGRAIQDSTVRRTLSVLSLFPKQGRPRKSPRIIEDGFGKPAMLFPSSPEEDERVWLNQARESLDAKTKVIGRKDFARGDENWLVLLDPVGTIHSRPQTRRDDLALLLAEYWKAGWFSYVFLQDTYFDWQMSFTHDQSSMLPTPPKEPTQEVLERDFQIDARDAPLFGT